MRAAFQRGRVTLVDAWGIPGSGKSTLLERAKSELASPADLSLRYTFGADDPRELDDDEQLAADYATFQAFAALLKTQVKSVAGEDDRLARLLDDFELAFDAARTATGPVNTHVFVAFAIVKHSRIASGGGEVDRKRPGLSAALATLLRGLTQQQGEGGGRRVLLALDEFEAVPSGRPLRAWVLELVRDLDSALVLAPRTPDLPAPEAGGRLDCPVGRLARGEIHELVAACAPGAGATDELLDAIEDATDGHPQAVALAVELLQRDQAPELDEFLAELNALPEDPKGKYAEMVAKILGRDGVGAERALRACSVLRKFDAELLAAVVGEEADDEKLRRYSFVEPAADPRGGFFRIHPVIRTELARRLAETDHARFLELHRRAAEHCASEVAGFEEEVDPESGAPTYASWYRYEDPRWQAAKREWLYHQAQASGSGDAEQELGRLRFARVFLDAFWWWGCYLKFPFCRDLIADWRATQKDRGWTDSFAKLLDAYPDGWEKDQAPAEWREGELPRWKAVRAALLSVRKDCGIAGNAAALRELEQRHVRGLVDTFLAHSYRYESSSHASYAKAVAEYDEAVALFERNEDDWDMAWTRFERGELHLEHGKADLARADWQVAAGLVAELEDEELAANLHRLAADAHFAAGDPDAAFAAQGRAVLHAYLFQRRPHRPDEYTLSFYAEQVDRALRRLLQHARAGGDQGRAAELLGAPFPESSAPASDEVAALCERKDQQRLSAALFPAPPTLDELNRERSRFLDLWLLAEDELDLPAPTDTQHSSW